jgi:hypothetical protein
MKIELARGLVPLPRPAAERRHPVVGGPALFPVVPDVPVPLRVVSRGPGLREPGVEVRGVVDHHVHHDPYAPAVRLGDQPVAVPESAEDRVDAAVIGDVVPEIEHGGSVDGREPDRVNAEPGQVIELFDDAGQVAHAVAARVAEAARIYLVDHAVLPPGESACITHNGTSLAITMHYSTNDVLW